MSPDKDPDLSVIIATHNRSALLDRCLGALRAQSLDPTRFEVVIADDGSTDGTAELCESFDAPFALRALRLEKSGQPSAQNAALAAARGAVCVILDDDTVPAPALLAEHLAAHRDGPALGIGKLTLLPPAARDWYAHAFARGWNEHYEELSRRPARWSDCYGANFSAPRDVLERSGGFAADLLTAQDLEIGFRLRAAGCAPTYLERAEATLDDRKRWPQMLADLRRQGSGHIEFVARHPSTLGDLLDWRAGGAGPLELALRRALIAIRLPASVLARAGWLVPGAGRKMIWFHLVRRFAFWQAVRQDLSRAAWKELIDPDRPTRSSDGKR